MSKFDVVIKGGTVIDGLRTPRYKADVGIAGGRVVAIGRVDASDGREVVDASDKVVAPGFVDLHTHYDSQVFWDPWCTMSGWHGVTSVVIGNCGFGFAPCRPEDRERAMLTVSRNEAVPLKTMRVGMPWDWVTYPEFLDSVDRTPKGVNVMSFVPLAPLYAYVAGVDNAKAYRVTDEQLDEMCRLLVEGMDGRRLRLQRAGLRRGRQRPARLRRHADGDRLHDRAGGDRLLPGHGLARSRDGAAHRHAGNRCADGARERPPDHLERLAGGRGPQPARRREVQPPRRPQAARLPERGGGPAGLRPGAYDQLRLGVHARGLQPGRHDPVLAGGLPRHRRREDGQVRRPGSPRRP